MKYGGWWFDPIIKRAARIFSRQSHDADNMAQEAYLALLRGMRRAYDTAEPTRGDYALAKTVVWNRLRGVMRRRRPPTIDPAIADELSPGDRGPIPPPDLPPSRCPRGQVARALLELGGCASQAEAASRLGLLEAEVCRALKEWGVATL